MHIKNVNDDTNDKTFKNHFRNYKNWNSAIFLCNIFLFYEILIFFTKIVGNNLFNLPFTIC